MLISIYKLEMVATFITGPSLAYFTNFRFWIKNMLEGDFLTSQL